MSNSSIIADAMQHMLKKNPKYFDTQHDGIEDAVGAGGFSASKAVLGESPLGSPVPGVKCIAGSRSYAAIMSRIATPGLVVLVDNGPGLPCFSGYVGVNDTSDMTSTVRVPGRDSRP